MNWAGDYSISAAHRAVTSALILLLAIAASDLRAADDLKLTPGQTQALEATRKGFGKGKKLQAEVEKLLAQTAGTNRVALAVTLAAYTAEQWPAEAPDALGKLVQLLPAHAVPILTAALKAAPKEARPLASAAMSASPTNTVRLASVAVQLVPAEGNAILEAASWRVPKELKPQLEQLRATLPAAVVQPPAKLLKVENPLSR